MPRMYRAMKADGNSPKIANSATGLGVRVVKDTYPDENGNVGPDSGGMSVSPTLESLPPMLVPRRLEHRVPEADAPDSVVCWVLGDGPFADGAVTEDLNFKKDKPHHGEVVPSRQMTLGDFQASLARTKEMWTNGE